MRTASGNFISSPRFADLSRKGQSNLHRESNIQVSILVPLNMLGTIISVLRLSRLVHGSRKQLSQSERLLLPEYESKMITANHNSTVEM